MNRINASRTAIETIIDSWILHERNRRLLRRRFVDGVTVEKIAEEFDLSPRQVSTIAAQGRQTILAHI